MKTLELAADQKPSLVATDEGLPPLAVSIGVFGKREFLSYPTLETLFEQEQFERLKERLYIEHPEEDERILAATTAKELAEIASELESSVAPHLYVLATAGGRLPRIDEVEVDDKSSMQLSWKAKGYGFGQVTLYVDKEGKLRAKNDGVSRQHLRAMLLRLADEVILER